MLLSELRTQTRKLVGDVVRKNAAGTQTLLGPQTWTDAEINQAINQAIQCYCEKTDVTYHEDLVTCSADGVATLPGSYFKVVRVMHNTDTP